MASSAAMTRMCSPSSLPTAGPSTRVGMVAIWSGFRMTAVPSMVKSGFRVVRGIRPRSPGAAGDDAISAVLPTVALHDEDEVFVERDVDALLRRPDIAARRRPLDVTHVVLRRVVCMVMRIGEARNFSESAGIRQTPGSSSRHENRFQRASFQSRGQPGSRSRTCPECRSAFQFGYPRPRARPLRPVPTGGCPPASTSRRGNPPP